MATFNERRLSLVADVDYFLALADQGLLQKIKTFPSTHRIAITDFTAYELAQQASKEARLAKNFISQHSNLIITFATDTGTWLIQYGQMHERFQNDSVLREAHLSLGLDAPSALPFDAGSLASLSALNRYHATVSAIHGVITVSTLDYSDAVLEAMIASETSL